MAASDDGCFVAVANIDSDDVTLIDARRLEPITTLRDPEADGPFDVTIVDGRAYVTNHLSDSISVFALGPCPQG